MNLPRRRFLHLAVGAAALPALSRIATAQTYPSRPVRVIVPFAPAGDTDLVARLMGQWLSERLGQPFIIDVSSGRRLHWSNPQGYKTRRPAGLAVDQIRIRRQPANGQGAWP
jgi:hypothetical protein